MRRDFVALILICSMPVLQGVARTQQCCSTQNGFSHAPLMRIASVHTGSFEGQRVFAFLVAILGKSLLKNEACRRPFWRHAGCFYWELRVGLHHTGHSSCAAEGELVDLQSPINYTVQRLAKGIFFTISLTSIINSIFHFPKQKKEIIYMVMRVVLWQMCSFSSCRVCIAQFKSMH